MPEPRLTDATISNMADAAAAVRRDQACAFVESTKKLAKEALARGRENTELRAENGALDAVYDAARIVCDEYARYHTHPRKRVR